MRSLRNYWKQLFPRSGKLAETPTPPAEQLEGELSAISGDNRTLAEEVRQFRADFERSRDEESRKIEKLEQVDKAIQLATRNEHQKLAELESGNRILQTEREADIKKVLDLERRLAEIEVERSELLGRVSTLEGFHTETQNKLQNTQFKINELQAVSAEQSKQFSASLQEAGDQIKSTENRLEQALGRLGEERKEYLVFFEHIQARFLKQDSRISWAMAATLCSLLLAATAAGLLVWEVQKNAQVLSNMTGDIRTLTSAMHRRADKQADSRLTEEQQPMPETDPGVIDELIDNEEDVSPATPESGADKTSEAATSEPYVSTQTAGDLGQDTSADLQAEEEQTAVSMANAFFRANAERDGVVSLSSGVQYRIVTPGSGRLPQPGDKLIVRYAGLRLDGTIFADTITTHQSAIVDMAEVVPEWREVFSAMREGVEFEVYLPPDHPAIKVFEINGVSENEAVVYLVRLLQVVDLG